MININKKIGRMLSFVLSVFLCASLVAPTTAEAFTFNPGFSVTSDAVYMINLDRDITVYSKNEGKKKYPASLTKIMTAIVVLDNVPEEELDSTYFEAPLAVFDDLYLTGALTIGFSKDEVISCKDLLYSMLIYSACDSAGILAYNVGGGSIPNFVDMMNAKLKKIGCTGTQFKNPHGLHDPQQYTNAEDMAKIASYAVKNYPAFREIACSNEYTMGATNFHEDGWITITHTNKLTNPSSSFYYEGSSGIKTGTTDESGKNLITLAEKNGETYVLCTLDAPMYDEDGDPSYAHFEDQIRLFNWAFDTLAFQTIIPEGKEITELPVRMGVDSDFVRLITANNVAVLWSKDIEIDKLGETIDTEGYIDGDDYVTAPVEKDKVLGKYSLSYNGEIIASVELVAQEGIGLSLTEYNIYKAKQFFGSVYFKAAIAIFVGATVIYIAIHNRINKTKKRKKVRKSRRF